MENIKNIDDLKNSINDLTGKLNNTLLKIKEKDKFRTERIKLVNELINHPNFNKNEKYFLLPIVSPPLYISYNTAIVGNSKSLLYYEYGNKINSYQDVIRFNYAHIDETLEKYCGNKTTIRVCNIHCLEGTKPSHHPKKLNNMNYKLYLKMDNMNFICFNKGGRSQVKKNNKKYKKNNNGFDFNWNLSFFKNISSYYDLKYTSAPQCGTGLMLILADLGLKPDIYGFDTKFCKDNYYYYWDTINKKCNSLSKYHNYKLEFNLLKILINKNLINLKTYNDPIIENLKPIKESVEESSKESVEESSKESVEESSKESVEESSKESVEESVEESSKESVEESVEESSKESVEESSKESVEESSKEYNKKKVKKPIKKRVKKPIKKRVKKPIKKRIKIRK